MGTDRHSVRKIRSGTGRSRKNRSSGSLKELQDVLRSFAFDIIGLAVESVTESSRQRIAGLKAQRQILLNQQNRERAGEKVYQDIIKDEDILAGAYRFLGVSREDTIETVKMVYRAKARAYHPDTGSGDEEKMKLLNMAYELVLKDIQDRRK